MRLKPVLFKQRYRSELVFGLVAACLYVAFCDYWGQLDGQPAPNASRQQDFQTTPVVFDEPARYPLSKTHSRFKPQRNLLKERYQLSDQDLQTLKDLPGVCQSELPGLDQQALEEVHGNERHDWKADELAGHKQNIEQLFKGDLINQILGEDLKTKRGKIPNPHAAASASYIETDKKTEDGGDPHLEVFSRTAFPSAQECATCHQQIYDEWAMSSHSYASISPMFHRFEDTINKLTSGTVGYFCLRCHAPVALSLIHI